MLTLLQARIAGAAVIALVIAALAGWALIERARRLDCQADRVRLEAQVGVLSDKLDQVNASVLRTAKAGQAAVATSRELLAEARRLAQPREAAIEKAEKAATAPAPAGKGCEDAWSEIEAGARP